MVWILLFRWSEPLHIKKGILETINKVVLKQYTLTEIQTFKLLYLIGSDYNMLEKVL